MLISLFSGIVASGLHVLSGPDHLAAVTPLAIESKKKSWKVGFSWGLGHTGGVFLIGLLFYFFRSFIPVEQISQYSELIVGFILIVIGVWAFIRIRRPHTHTHMHVHTHEHAHTEEHTHTHPHVHIHTHESKHGEQHELDPQHAHNYSGKSNIGSAILIGLIHGFAGVSHLVSILPTLALPSKAAAAMYLTGFGMGTIGAMVAFAAALGLFSHSFSKNKNTKMLAILRYGGAIAAVLVGIFWISLSFAG